MWPPEIIKPVAPILSWLLHKQSSPSLRVLAWWPHDITALTPSNYSCLLGVARVMQQGQGWIQVPESLRVESIALTYSTIKRESGTDRSSTWKRQLRLEHHMRDIHTVLNPCLSSLWLDLSLLCEKQQRPCRKGLDYRCHLWLLKSPHWQVFEKPPWEQVLGSQGSSDSKLRVSSQVQAARGAFKSEGSTSKEGLQSITFFPRCLLKKCFLLEKALAIPDLSPLPL